MPSRVELKLLSNSGELLHVATCYSGKISVLRASSPGELRPYQRALSGSSAKDNLEILVDGSVYQAEENTVLGFGEPSPTTGLSVREFLTGNGISELSLKTQLLSIGLEEIADKRCSELSLDQEARLRLLVASVDVDKVLVLNDPFENISTKWRERVAELLANFAKSRNSLIIIPSLSYRPDAWIDNESITRIEVGQTSQRTIGFGAAGSLDNAALEEIRQKLLNNPNNSAKYGAAAAGMAAGINPGLDSNSLHPEVATISSTKGASLFTAAKLLFTLIGSSVGGWALYTAVNQMTLRPQPATPSKTIVASARTDKLANPDTNNQSKAVERSKDEKSNQMNPSSSTTSKANLAAAEVSQAVYILDSYPAAIKASILDSARGITGYAQIAEQAPSQPSIKKGADSGNLFSLLAAAGNSKGKTESYNSDSKSYSTYRSDEPDEDIEEEDDTPADPTEMGAEEAQREQIRQRFLEAIRASATRRQAEAEELQ